MKQNQSSDIAVEQILKKEYMDALKDYTKQRKEGKDPQFKAADIGLKDKVDFWN